jgi:PAS domain S-box-containing protein
LISTQFAYFWMDTNYVYKLPSGEIVAIYDDISQQKKADEKIKFQSKLLESVGQSVIAADADGKINYWNKVAEQTYGWSAEEAIGEDVTKLTMVPQGKPFMELVSNGNAWSDEVEALCKDGRRVPVLFSNTPIVNIDGCLMGIVSVSSDLTDRKKMEAIGTLSGGIAHDFNNILTAIIGNTELALFEAAKGTQIEENLQEILSSGMRARELIKQILALSRHSVNIDKPFPIEPLVKEALQMLRSVIPTSIEFRENITSEQLVVKADPTQIHQVVVNLATNAKQAMTNGFGVLEIRLERMDFDEDVRSLHPEIGPGKYARISVSDTGCGIPEEDLGKIFEPYFTTKGNEIGTGMGLSVVHGNVRKSNGHIIVDSEVGKGTTFHVYLPLVEKAEPVYTSETIESIPKGVESILFVDDEPTIVKMQKQRLEHLGYKVTVKSNPLEAIEMFRSSPDQFDLVITDMTMPKMTGDKLSMEIKAIRSGVPVIMCTGFSEKIEGKNEDLDIDVILMKPTDLSLMATTIRKLLDGARLKTR